MNAHITKVQKHRSQSVANAVAQKQHNGAPTFQFVDNRPSAIAQRKLQEVANNGQQVSQLRAFQEMADGRLQVEPMGEQVLQRFLLTTGKNNNIKYYSSYDKQKKLFDDSALADAYDRELERQLQPMAQAPQPAPAKRPAQAPKPALAQRPAQAPKPAPGPKPAQAPQPALAQRPAQAPKLALAQRPAQAPKPAPAPQPSPEEIIGRKYPLGFESEEQFRELTRPIAKANRDAAIVVTGSSVTGRSGDGKRNFRNNRTPNTGARKSGPSDIDLGIVKPRSKWQPDVADSGFPIRSSKSGALERAYGQKVQKTTGHPSGIKFFNSMPVEGRGRTPHRERVRLVREHTPEGQREEDEL
jgi:hypothetical protein